MDTTQTLSPDTFKLFFEQLKPKILETWPQLSPESLTAPEGRLEGVSPEGVSLEGVIEKISVQTGQSHEAIRAGLLALFEQSQTLTSKGETGQNASEIDQLVKRILHRTEAAIAQLNSETLPELQNTVRTYPTASLVSALGLGFLLGFTVRGAGHARK